MGIFMPGGGLERFEMGAHSSKRDCHVHKEVLSAIFLFHKVLQGHIFYGRHWQACKKRKLMNTGFGTQKVWVAMVGKIYFKVGGGH